MIALKGIVNGPIAVTTDTDLRGIAKGDVTVASGCVLRVSGMLTGSILLEADARVEITGMVSGSVVRM